MHTPYVLYQLIKRDIKMSFAGSVFGTLWMFMNPLLMTGVFYLIFQHIVKVKFPPDATDGANYTVYLLAGLAFWNGFNQSLLRGMNAITDNAYLLKKTSVPPYLFILASTTTGFIYTFVSLGYALVLKDFPYSLKNIPLLFFGSIGGAFFCGRSLSPFGKSVCLCEGYLPSGFNTFGLCLLLLTHHIPCLLCTRSSKTFPYV